MSCCWHRLNGEPRTSPPWGSRCCQKPRVSGSVWRSSRSPAGADVRVRSCGLQAGLRERLFLCWEVGVWALLHPAKRPKKEAGHSSSKAKKRKMGCVLGGGGGGEDGQNTESLLSELEGRTIQLYANHAPWRMMCVQLRKRVSSLRRLCKHGLGAWVSSFAHCLYSSVIPLV